MVLNGGSSIVLNGVSAKHVLFNVQGSQGGDVSMTGGSGANLWNGTILAPLRKFAVHDSILNGALIGGNDIAVTSNATVKYIPFSTPGSIGNFIWKDLNANGQQDAGEPGVRDVIVHLYNSSGTLIAGTATTSTGLYQFNNIDPGSYQIEMILPHIYKFTTANTGSDLTDSDIEAANRTAMFVLDDGEIKTSIDAGVVRDPNAVPLPSSLPGGAALLGVMFMFAKSRRRTPD
jgi:hypothetical protein